MYIVSKIETRQIIFSNLFVNVYNIYILIFWLICLKMAQCSKNESQYFQNSGCNQVIKFDFKNNCYLQKQHVSLFVLQITCRKNFSIHLSTQQA